MRAARPDVPTVHLHARPAKGRPPVIPHVLLGIAVLLSGCGASKPAAPLETTVIAHGPFEILAQGRRIPAGGWPNNGGSPFATMEVTSFSVRHRGVPVTVTHGDRTLSQFWRVVRLLDAPAPAVLACTTDFHLLSDEHGQLAVRSLGEPSTDLAEYQWLDADQGQPTPPGTFGIEHVDLDRGTTLRGGRWLRLGNHTVLDVRTLRAFPVRPWIDYEPGRPFGGLGGGGPARVFSPGQTQFVTIGSGYAHDADGAYYEALLVVDIPTGSAYGLAVSRRAQHYLSADDVTPAWLAHHFRWTRDAEGHERLVPRADARPLPWRGRFRNRDGDSPEYHLVPVRSAAEDLVRGYLVERMGAVGVPDEIAPDHRSDRTFRVPGCDGIVTIFPHDDTIAVYSAAGLHSQATCPDAVRRLGDGLDAELVRGAHQELFLEDAAGP